MDSGPRVLLAEADEAVASSLVDLLGQFEAGAEVVRAATGDEAIGLVESQAHFDAIIVADELPDGPGTRVSQWVHGSQDDAPVVMLVRGEDATVWETATRAGVTVILPAEGLTAERLQGGLGLARQRAVSERLTELLADAATSLDEAERLDHQVGGLLVQILAVTRAEGVRLSVSVLSSKTRVWARGAVGPRHSAALQVSARTAGSGSLLELFDAPGTTWGAVRPGLTALCEVISAALVRQESLKRVRTSEARLRDLAENVPEAIVSVDAAGRIAAANRRFSRAVGWDSTVGVRLADLAEPHTLAALAAQAVDESRLTGLPVTLPDQRVEVPDAGERWHEAKASPDDAGTVHVVLPDTTERVNRDKRLTQMALHDYMTGLPNRRLAIDRLQHALDQVGRGRRHLVVSMCDIDHFKSTNDLFGHAAGDTVLLALADRLRRAIRSSDTAARLGGDEFLIISEGIESPQAADVVIHRLHDRLCGPVTVGEEQLNLSVSLGYVVVSDPGRSADDILRQADLALYSAKAAGRGRCAAYGVQAAASSEHELSDRLERAWRHGQFVPRWAPIACLDGSIQQARVMLGWIDDDGVERHPDELVAALSNGPLFSRVRRSLVADGLQQRRRWCAEGLVDEDFTIHVRVFARQLADPHLTTDILNELAVTETAPTRLVLDVEDQAVRSSPGSVHRLEQLVAAGVRIHLDRFGAGGVPIDRLTWPALAGVWLDRSLIDGVWREPRRAAVVDSLLEMGVRAGLEIIVDGVDHPEELGWFASRPPVALTGPLVGGPMAVEAMQQRLASGASLERFRSPRPAPVEEHQPVERRRSDR